MGCGCRSYGWWPILLTKISYEAIKHGKQVVTANKALLAEHGNELFKAAEDNAVQIVCEAAAVGGIPLLK